MKSRFARILLVTAVLAVSGVDAQERIALTTPETVAALGTFRVEQMTLTWDDPATAGVDEGVLVVQLLGVERPVPVSCVYTKSTTPTATTLITGLNKANLSTAYAGNATTGSLLQRIHHRFVVMGEASAICGRALVGTLTGTPQ